MRPGEVNHSFSPADVIQCMIRKTITSGVRRHHPNFFSKFTAEVCTLWQAEDSSFRLSVCNITVRTVTLAVIYDCLSGQATTQTYIKYSRCRTSYSHNSK